MNRIHCYFTLFLSSLCISIIYAEEKPLSPLATRITARSVSRDKSIEMVGLSELTHIDTDEWYVTFALTPEYLSSRKSKEIVRCLFNADSLDSNTYSRPNRSIRIQGSSVPGRSMSAWLADYFYLPRDFDSVISFKPHYKYFLLNFDLYVGLDSWVKNMYVRFYGPFAYTRWNMDLRETIETEGTAGYPAGYFAPSEIPADALLKSFTAYARGDTIKPVDGVIFNGLNAGRMYCDAESKAGMADIRFEMGKNFLNNEDYRLGANIQAALPTGKSPDVCNLFGPQLGNDFWELGVGAIGLYRLYCAEDEDMHILVSFDANLTHLFKHKQKRFFDLKDKRDSRYMLMARMKSTNPAPLSSPSGATTEIQFDAAYSPLANLTANDVHVSCAIQADICFMTTFAWGGLNFDVGYQFWYRSGESIHPIKDYPSTFESEMWAIKGDARTGGFLSTNRYIPLSATESQATIYRGHHPGTDATNNINQFVNSPQPAISDGGNVLVTSTGPQIFSSFPPVLLSPNDIEYRAGTEMSSHKLFAYLGYATDFYCITPFIGIGGFIEFADSDTVLNDEETCKRKSVECGIPQWAAYLKVGFSFN